MSGALTTIQGEFQERVKNHIKDTFVSLIPEEQFAQMVNAEIKAFFEDPTEFIWESGGYNSPEKLKAKITPFRQLVWRQVKAIVESELLKWFAGDQEAQFREFVQELLGTETVKEGTALTVQKLMIVMAGQMFYNCAVQANMQMRGDLQAIFQRHGFPMQAIFDLSKLNMNSVYAPAVAPGAEPPAGTIHVPPSYNQP